MTIDGHTAAHIDAAGPASISARPMKVFVHLARNKEATWWRKAHANGKLVGVNDDTPYGYGRANRMGCDVVFSESRPENIVAKIVRLGLRILLGFDLLHSMRQLDELQRADVVWTHTESQFLGVAAVLSRQHASPILIGQSVWLFDRWPRLNVLQRALYRRLIERVDLLTTLSTNNRDVAKAVFPKKRVEWVPFGISAEIPVEPILRGNKPVRVVSLGNDRDRDWSTLIEATRDQPDVNVLICSGTANRYLLKNARNVEIRSITQNEELHEILRTASVMCVPLVTNKHASGITVILEAVLAGVPVIAADTGGLRDYFGPEEVRYVPVGNVEAMRLAVQAAGEFPEAMLSMARRAQARMISAGLSAEMYVKRHVDLSREMMTKRAQ